MRPKDGRQERSQRDPLDCRSKLAHIVGDPIGTHTSHNDEIIGRIHVGHCPLWTISNEGWSPGFDNESWDRS